MGSRQVTSPGHSIKTAAVASISGRISDDQNVAAANTRVCAQGTDLKISRRITREPRCNRTSTSGEYTINDLVPGRYVVSAMGNGYVPGAYRHDGDTKAEPLALGPGEKREHIDIVLKHGGAEITGMVADLGGGPVPHAQIHIEDPNNDAIASTESDEVGKFTLYVGPDEMLVVADADGYATGYARGRAPGTFNIELTPGASISGTVVDAVTSQPLAGVRVDASTREWIGFDAPPGDVTDDEGRFTIDRLSPGRYSILVRQPRLVGSSEGSVTVGLGQQVTGIVVRTFPAVRIEGRVVVAGSSARPCTAPHLSLAQHGYEQNLHSGNGSDGNVFADGVLPGTYEVQVFCKGYVSHNHYEPIQIANADLKGLSWEVVPGGTIHGRVTSRSGAPLSGVSVFGYGTPATETDTDGHYEIRGVEEGDHVLLVRSDTWTAPSKGWTVKLPPQGEVEQNLVLDATGNLRGSVVDDDDKPIEAAVVSIEIPASWDQQNWMSTHAESAETRSDGSFEISSLPAADYKLTARRADDTLVQQTTVVAPRTSTVRFVFKKANQVISGFVTDSSSSPITDAYVTATREIAGSSGTYFNDENAVLTRPDGSFTIRKLRPGTYTVKAFRKGGGQGFADHVAAGGVAKLTIAQTGTIEGVVRIGGVLAQEIYVDAVDAAKNLRSEHFFGTHGHYVMRDLQAGRYRLSAHVGHRVAQVSATLAEGEHKTDVNIDSDGGVTLRGRVLDLATKLPAARVKVLAGLGDDDRPELDDLEPRTVLTDDAGRFQIDHVPAGRVVVSASGSASVNYGWSGVIVEVGASPVDVGDLGIVKARVGRNDPNGDLGVTWVQYPDDTPSNQRAFEVAAIDPNGPAAVTYLKVGDVVVSVDGFDARGGNRSSAWTLMLAPPGTALKLGLAGGSTVTIVLAKP